MTQVVFDDEDDTVPASMPIILKAVSKAQEPWNPILGLGDSVHAYAWWALSKDELAAIVAAQRKESTKKAGISYMINPPPISQGPPKPKGSVADQPGTSSKSSSVIPKPESQKAKQPMTKVPSVPSETVSTPKSVMESPTPKRAEGTPTVEFRGNAGVREPSVTRGRKVSGGLGGRNPFAAATVLGRGTPSIPPITAVGMAGTPITQPASGT